MTVDKQIDGILQWFENNSKSQNIVEINLCLNKLAILSVTIANDVADAYEQMNLAEDLYDEAVSVEYSTLIKDNSAAMSKETSAARCIEYKKVWTRAKNLYKRLSLRLDKIERVQDSYKQFVSTLKDERKYSNGGV